MRLDPGSLQCSAVCCGVGLLLASGCDTHCWVAVALFRLCLPGLNATHPHTHTRTLQDIVERFQLLLVLCFVVVEDISNSGTWWPAPGTLLECGRIFIWEVRGGFRVTAPC